MTTPLLQITDLHVEIRNRRQVVTPVDGVSLEIAPGEVLGLVGESGSGKTMTALSLLGLLPPGGRASSGRIELDGRDLLAMPERRLRDIRGNQIGMVFQDPLSSLNPTMTVGDQVAEAVLLHRDVSRRAAMDRAIEVLGLVGLPAPRERSREYAHQFSGGMRQRVMIAMALACQPKLLIADEPTTALDVTIQKQILRLLDRLREQLDMAVLLVTHDLGVVAGHADRVAVMYAGRIVETATTEELYQQPHHPYTRALFEALPERAMEGTVRRLRAIPGMPPDLRSRPPGCSFAPRCDHAQDRCLSEDPALAPDNAGRRVACLFPLLSGDMRRPSGAPDATDRVHNDTAPVIQLRAVSKEFPVVRGLLRKEVARISAVSEVTLEVPRGTTVGLVGESGCGKSTLGNLIVGLERPTSGEIVVDDRDLTKLRGAAARARRARVQLMFQDSAAAMDPRMRVGAILQEPLRLQRVGTPASRRARVAELLNEVGLPADAVDRYPHEFSGGQRQRLALARALALEPELIVADEPVSALDVSIRAQVLNVFRDLQRRHGMSLLIISHDLSVIRYLADTIGVMYLGKLVEIGPAAQVYSNPRHHYTRGLIDAVPVADPATERTRRTAGVTGELASAADPPSGCRFRTRCSAATEICAQVEPPLDGADGHRFACHHPLDVRAGVAAGELTFPLPD
ncbi:MAG TPA: ABC transporter ATP-binding protein [Mycobacteriales bacterium]|nr:ABC transporter ATP-binding protein [Mycobacteriales bacterium]